MELSKEHKDSLITSGLYIKKEIPSNTWCKNWTFTIRMDKDRVFLSDTYYRDHFIELTDENFDEFEFIMDFDKVKEVGYETWEIYVPEKRFNFATDSGGWKYSKYFVLKDAKPSRELYKNIVLNKIKNLENTICCYKLALINLDKDSTFE